MRRKAVVLIILLVFGGLNLLTVFHFVPIVQATSIIIDSYGEGNRSTNSNVMALHPSASGSLSSNGQCFTGQSGYILDSCKFYLKKLGLPVGTLLVQVFAITGTFGTNATPTGVALATSSSYNMADLDNTTFNLITFTFSTSLTLTATNYALALEAATATTLNASNDVNVGIDASASTHSGNAFSYHNSAWDGVTYGSYDYCFYVYGTLAPTGWTKVFDGTPSGSVDGVPRTQISSVDGVP